MLILILIDVQYLQNVFSFEKSSNGQNHSSDSNHLITKFLPAKFHISPTGGIPPPLNAIWKTVLVLTSYELCCMYKHILLLFIRLG